MASECRRDAYGGFDGGGDVNMRRKFAEDDECTLLHLETVCFHAFCLRGYLETLLDMMLLRECVS